MVDAIDTTPQYNWYKLSCDVSLTDEQVKKIGSLAFQKDFARWLCKYLGDKEVATMFGLTSSGEISILTAHDDME